MDKIFANLSWRILHIDDCLMHPSKNVSLPVEVEVLCLEILRKGSRKVPEEQFDHEQLELIFDEGRRNDPLRSVFPCMV